MGRTDFVRIMVGLSLTSMTPNMDMSNQELYFRSLVALFGIAVVVGAFVIESALLLQLLNGFAGLIALSIALLKRFKLWL